MSDEIRINVCRHCKSENRLFDLYCKNCGKQIFYKRNYESKTLEELNRIKKSLNRRVFVGMIVFHSLILDMALFYFFFRKGNQDAITTTGLYFLVALVVALTLAVPSIISLGTVEKYKLLRDEQAYADYMYFKERFEAGHFKKPLKDELESFKQKFLVNDERYKNTFHGFRKVFNFHLILAFITAGLFCMMNPIFLFTRDLILSTLLGIYLAMFSFYFYSEIKKKLEKYTEKFKELFSREAREDYEQMLYFIHSYSFRRCGFCLGPVLIVLIVLIFTMSQVS